MTQQSVEPPASVISTASTHQDVGAESSGIVNGVIPHTDDDKEQGEVTPDACRIGQCKAIYDFSPEQDDELTLKEGK